MIEETNHLLCWYTFATMEQHKDFQTPILTPPQPHLFPYLDKNKVKETS